MYKKYKKNTKKLQEYAHKLIPGLSGLLGKRPEMYLPGGNWPTYYHYHREITEPKHSSSGQPDFGIINAEDHARTLFDPPTAHLRSFFVLFPFFFCSFSLSRRDNEQLSSI